ncbi:unnamed protein product [Vitrella brassicaformis CCMP3155]|uniref:RNA-editing substrate-binding complex 6 protein domain-containing protein n=2 Tax=Vitrella brassicaformis TaxID=1169539 RepID=A0A0G4ELP1_VITBC|nr:unnamed protein product [Vitrella brassicaformis CCMP3155]|eukprot:CEL98031.1 unnamed protein product [Vitrella brassicaformis CCMP3155]
MLPNRAFARPPALRNSLPAAASVKHQGRSFAKKRERLSEYDKYEQTVNPQRIPYQTFVRTPIHHMEAGQLIDTIETAGQLTLSNRNFWKRCSTALMDLASSLKTKELARAVIGFSKGSHADPKLFNVLSKYIALKATELTHTDMAVIVAGYGRLGIRHEPLFDVLAQELLHRLPHMAAKGVASVAFHYAKVDIYRKHLFDAVAREVIDKSNTYPPQELCQVAWAFSRLNIVDEALVNVIAEEVKLGILHFSVPEVVAIAESLSRLGCHQRDLAMTLEEHLATRLLELPLDHIPSLLSSFSRMRHRAFNFYRRLSFMVIRAPRHLKPKEIGQILQALQTAGYRDTLLEETAATAVPHKLRSTLIEERVGMLESYAASGNPDAFMTTAIMQSFSSPASTYLGDALADRTQMDDTLFLRCILACAALDFKAGVVRCLRALGLHRVNYDPWAWVRMKEGGSDEGRGVCVVGEGVVPSVKRLGDDGEGVRGAMAPAGWLVVDKVVKGMFPDEDSWLSAVEAGDPPLLPKTPIPIPPAPAPATEPPSPLQPSPRPIRQYKSEEAGLVDQCNTFSDATADFLVYPPDSSLASGGTKPRRLKRPDLYHAGGGPGRGAWGEHGNQQPRGTWPVPHLKKEPEQDAASEEPKSDMWGELPARKQQQHTVRKAPQQVEFAWEREGGDKRNRGDGNEASFAPDETKVTVKDRPMRVEAPPPAEGTEIGRRIVQEEPSLLESAAASSQGGGEGGESDVLLDRESACATYGGLMRILPEAPADALVQAICSFPADSARPQWQRQLRPHVTACRAELLPALMIEVIKARDQATADEEDGEQQDALTPAECEDLYREIAAHLLTPSPSPHTGHPTHADTDTDTPLVCEYLSLDATTAALRALQMHWSDPKGRIGLCGHERRTMEELVAQLGGELVRNFFYPYPDGHGVEERERGEGTAKQMARALQAVTALDLAAPRDLCRSLVQRAGDLSADDLVSVLRLFVTQHFREEWAMEKLSLLVSVRRNELKSWAKHQHLEELCRQLGIDSRDAIEFYDDTEGHPRPTTGGAVHHPTIGSSSSISSEVTGGPWNHTKAILPLRLSGAQEGGSGGGDDGGWVDLDGGSHTQSISAAQ